LVERSLKYSEVASERLVAAEAKRPVPARPRLDHVAVTSGDLAATQARWEGLGYVLVGSLLQDDPRGLAIYYLRADPRRGASDIGVDVEVFTFTDPTYPRAPQVGALGFGAAVLKGGLPAGSDEIGQLDDGVATYADPDGLFLVKA
jgi:catechol 2,3-dioxygenase-like lactoylglutathione lyase family enzyme